MKDKKENKSSEKISMLEHKLFSEPEPVFSREKELYVPFGCNINVYNPSGGSLLNVLKGHKCKIINLLKSKIKGEEVIISCDEEGVVFRWFTNKEYVSKNSSVKMPVKEKFIVTQLAVIVNKYFLVTYAEGETTAKLCCWVPPSSKLMMMCPGLQIGLQKMAISPDLNYLAYLTEREMFVCHLVNNKTDRKYRSQHLCGDVKFVSVVFHPTKSIIATGTLHGCAILWYNFMDSKPVKTNLHWHSMPLYNLCFSRSGNDLYTGSGECVLVRWSLNERNKKSFLPRLGSPICAISTETDESLVAVRHLDSTVSIINAREMKLSGVLNNLADHVPHDRRLVHSAGLSYHPPTGTLVANGRTGHLQFFIPQSKKIVYNLDVSLSNFVSRQENKILPNNEVTKVAISEDGLWLATSEICELTSGFTEIILKFWQYSLENQRWEMNANILMPHSDVINSMAMSPLTEKDKVPMCVSCSEEGKFTIWMLLTFKDVLGKTKQHWNSCFSKEFKGYAATACSFSPDGSLLAVAFENIITLWTPKNCTLIGSLSQPYLREKICDLSFSSAGYEGSYIVTRSPGYLCSWDLLTCSLRWRVFLRTTCMTADQVSGLKAVFSEEKEVFVFEPRLSEPLNCQKNLCDANIICASFVNVANQSGKLEACLCLLDVHQKFYFIENIITAAKITPMDDQVDSQMKEKEESEVYSALVPKMKTQVELKINEDSARVIPGVSVINTLMKEINEIRIHNLAFEGLLNHVQNFLPDLRLEPNKDEEKRKKLNYSTIEEYSSETKKVLESLNSSRLKRVEAFNDPQSQTLIQDLDYSKIVEKL